MALTSIENHTKAKMRRGFVTQKAEDRGTSKQSLIQENIMLQKMAGVWKDHPLALFIPHPRIQIGINQVDEEIE